MKFCRFALLIVKLVVSMIGGNNESGYLQDGAGVVGVGDDIYIEQ